VIGPPSGVATSVGVPFSNTVTPARTAKSRAPTASRATADLLQ